MRSREPAEGGVRGEGGMATVLENRGERTVRLGAEGFGLVGLGAPLDFEVQRTEEIDRFEVPSRLVGETGGLHRTAPDRGSPIVG